MNKKLRNNYSMLLNKARDKVTLDSITFTKHTQTESFDIHFRIAFTDKHGGAMLMRCELPCYGGYDQDDDDSINDNLKENKAHAKRYLRMLGCSVRSIDLAIKHSVVPNEPIIRVRGGK